jgi:geranylgeranyl diphosphate synthase type I
MTIDAYFRKTKERLRRDLDAFLSAKRKDAGRIEPWGRDVLGRLATFTRKGKMVRGGLVALGCEMAAGRIAPAAIRAGVAFELIQSGLLIHDDIMDRDARRRGAPSIHEQYALLAGAAGRAEAAHFGTSMAICAGEIAIFLAFEALAGLPGPAERAVAVQRLSASEFGLVGLGQMLDVRAGTSRAPLPERAVLDIYRYKTARYTFSLPLAAGWILGGGRSRVVPRLQRLGEDLGLVFQIKDDELGLFGNAGTTGKPVGSDIRQGKQTLYSLRLIDRAAGPDRTRLEAVFGRGDATEADILFVRDLAGRLGVREDVARVAAGLGRQVEAGIRALPVGEKNREILRSLLDYSLGRRS